MRLARSVLAVTILCLAGCGGPADTRPSAAPPGVEGSVFESGKVEHVRMGMTPIGPAPNSGLQLPAVTPDGRRIAALHVPAGRMVAPQSLISGIGLEPVSLRVRDLDSEGGWRMICPAGAAWPRWSPDGATLLYVVYRDGGCKLGLYYPLADNMRLIAPGPKHMLMPAMSPDSRNVALVLAGQLPNHARVNAWNLARGQLVPAPGGDDVTWQLWPVWVDDDTLIYLQRSDRETRWVLWKVGAEQTTMLPPIAAPPDMGSAIQMLVGMGAPLNRRSMRLAWYDPIADAISVMDLAGGAISLCPEGTRAACWLGPDRLLAAGEDELLVCEIRPGESSRLLRGQWLPLWATPDGREMVLAAPGDDPTSFELVRAAAILD